MDTPPFDPIFEPLVFPHLTLPNRLLRSSLSGRFDNYDGSGNRARINWELSFARGGVGAIISSFIPVHAEGRILPNYARIDSDDKIPFWRELIKEVNAAGARYIIQLSHSGRQRDLPSLEYPGPAPSSTSVPEPLHGLPCRAMTVPEIKQIVSHFVDGARRAREAGADGIELHGANGYLFTQFLSSGINDRRDEYGGSLENRARFAREVVQGIRREIGRDHHLQFKISGTDYNNALFPWDGKGNTIDESIQVVKWLKEDGIDAVHVSSGSSFPHPHNPGGGFPVSSAPDTYDIMLRSGLHTKRNYWIFSHWPASALFDWWWKRRGGPADPEGANLEDAKKMKDAVGLPVIVTGGFQHAAVIRDAIARGLTDAISIARPLIANRDLPLLMQRNEQPKSYCTYCNKCLANVLKNPLACYEESRFSSHEEMMKTALSVFSPPPYTDEANDGGETAAASRAVAQG